MQRSARPRGGGHGDNELAEILEGSIFDFAELDAPPSVTVNSFDSARLCELPRLVLDTDFSSSEDDFAPFLKKKNYDLYGPSRMDLDIRDMSDLFLCKLCSWVGFHRTRAASLILF